MLVATFGPASAWVGKTITHENGRFMLEGAGRISAAQVLEYDRASPLTWSTEGTRAWVRSLAQSGAPEASRSPACRFDRGHYLGGHLGLAVTGGLRLTTQSVQIDLPDGSAAASLPLALVTGAGVHGGRAAGTAVVATIHLGSHVFGARDADDRTFLLMHVTSGECATYAIGGTAPPEVRAAIGPILAQAGVPFADAPPTAPGAPEAGGQSTMEEVERLAEQHAAGSLTDAEFRTRLGPLFTTPGFLHTGAAATPVPDATIDAALEALATLRAEGAITDADVAAMKAKLLE